MIKKIPGKRPYIFSAALYLSNKNAHISGPTQFNAMLFRVNCIYMIYERGEERGIILMVDINCKMFSGFRGVKMGNRYLRTVEIRSSFLIRFSKW